MNLSIMNYFDIGISFGINDHPFLSDEKIEKLKAKIGYQVQYPTCDLPVGINKKNRILRYNACIQKLSIILAGL